MTNKQIEFTTLRELRNNLGLALDNDTIENIINSASYGNDFYIGTNVKQWLKSFHSVDENMAIELFSQIDEEEEVVEGSFLDTQLEVITHDNSYNWGGHSNCDIDYKILQDVNQNVYAYVRIHQGGDIRGNYTDGILLDLDTYNADAYTLFENVHENGEGAYIEYDGNDWSIYGNIASQYLSLYNHTTHKDYEICASVYTWNEEEFKKECIEVIKEAIA